MPDSRPWHRLTSCFLLLLLLCPLSVLAEEEPRYERPLIIGGDYNYPPYEYLDKSSLPAGYNIELTKAVARVMGLDVNIRLASWGEMRRGLEQGDIDLLMGMAHTEERLAQVDFSIPHAKVHQSIWIRNGNVAISSVRDLTGKEVIVMKGSVMHDFMLEREIPCQPVPGFDPGGCPHIALLRATRLRSGCQIARRISVE